MTIIERNFYRLLRSGAFNAEEQIEPLSAWKWNRLYKMSEMHDVATIVYKGIERCKDQFFVQIPEELMNQWSKATNHGSDEENDLLVADHLTNPILNHKLQSILDTEDSNTETRTALLHLSGIARFIMNAGIPVKRIVEFGAFLKQSSRRIDFTTLQQWIKQLKMENMVQIIGVMMVKLLHFGFDDLPFVKPEDDFQMERMIRDIFQQKNSHAEEWYFSQGKDIFVHTSNSSAMLWQVRRTAKYFRFYPTESLTNFFTTFAHSLSHIEE